MIKGHSVEKTSENYLLISYLHSILFKYNKCQYIYQHCNQHKGRDSKTHA